jgi:hypothetical protein
MLPEVKVTVNGVELAVLDATWTQEAQHDYAYALGSSSPVAIPGHIRV